MTTAYEFAATRLGGREEPLATYAGQVLLIVNTASRCGFTPQYAGLERLQQVYADRGFTVLGFPCNQFGFQEPGNAATIGDFCERNYGVSFPMFAKVVVNGANAHPLYRFLKAARPGLLGSGFIKWNFTKFLVNRSGQVVDRFAPLAKPAALAPLLERIL